jgi:hypothetical protein
VRALCDLPALHRLALLGVPTVTTPALLALISACESLTQLLVPTAALAASLSTRAVRRLHVAAVGDTFDRQGPHPSAPSLFCAAPPEGWWVVDEHEELCCA